MPKTDAPAYRHPMRDLGILVYHCPKAPPGRAYLAFFDRQDIPVYFPASTGADAYRAALHWRNEQVAKHEAAYIAKQETLAKARKARKRKAVE